MVDSIGWKATRPATRTTPVAPTSLVRPAPSSNSAAAVASPDTVRTLAAKPPVDLERVSRIRKAIADGAFPVVSSTIADRLLALKLQWNLNGPARDPSAGE